MDAEMYKALKRVIELHEEQMEKGLVPFSGEGQKLAKDMEAAEDDAEADMDKGMMVDEDDPDMDKGMHGDDPEMDKGHGMKYDAEVMGMQSAMLSGIIAGASEYSKAGNYMSYKGSKDDMMAVNGHLRAMSKAHGDMMDKADEEGANGLPQRGERAAKMQMAKKGK